MATTHDFAALLRRHADASPEDAVRALLASFLKDAPRLRSWLIAHDTVSLRQIARDDAAWPRLTQAARKHRSKTPDAIRRDYAQRLVTHALRSYDCAPSQSRKARIIAAAFGAQALAEETPRDTVLLTQVDLAARLHIGDAALRKWLTIAEAQGVIREVARARDGRRRFVLRKWPTAHKPTEVERRASESILAGRPNEVAQWILSVTHPAWGYSPKPIVAEGESTPPYLNHHLWERNVLKAAGILRTRGDRAARETALAEYPADLDLRFDAFARFEVAWARREADAAARARSAADDQKVRKALRGLAWPPESDGLAAWSAQARMTLAQYPVPDDLVTPFNAKLRRELSRLFPDEVEHTLASLREDIFDDHQYAVH